MLKVNNKKFIRHLATKSFGASKNRNIIAIVAIALTSLLFTSLFTIGIGCIESIQNETMRQVGGDSHGVIKNITPEQYEILSQDPLIKESAACMLVADNIDNEEFVKRHMEAWYIPEHHYDHNFIEIIDGRAPLSANEILVDEMSLKLMGLDPVAGQQITLKMRIKSYDEMAVDRTFTVSGVTKSDPALNVGFAIMSEEYLQAYANELEYTYDKDYSITGAVRMDITFANSVGIQKNINKVITNAGFSIDINDENYLESNANWAYVSDGGETDPMTIGILVCGLVIIMLTGYLIIYNIFQISVIRDIRYYGLLKTIGTTGKQIRTIIRTQAMILGALGIPIGLIFGYIIGKSLVPQVLSISSMSDNAVVSLNPIIFVGAAIFTFITIGISTGRPARIASKVSPVEAVKFNEGNVKSKKSKKTTDGGKIWRMALSNFGRNKKKTVLVVLSLSLAVILLNSVFTITHAFSMDSYLKKFVSSDFQIGNASYFGINHYWGINENMAKEEKLSESFIEECESLDGFENGGRLYGCMSPVGVKRDSFSPPDSIPRTENGYLGRYWGGSVISLNVNEDDSYSASFYGMEDFFYEQLDVWKGEENIDVIKEKLSTGKYLLYAVTTDDNNFVEEDNVMFQPGDKIVLTYDGGKEREFEILSLVKEDYYGMTNRSSSFFALYTTADIFKEMASSEFLMKYSFNVADDKEKEVGAFLEDYTTTAEPIMDYESKEDMMEQFMGLQTLVTVIGGILAFIVGIIGILNFVNSILTSIVTRQTEFAILEAIGMTKKQQNRMLVLEGTYYALSTIIFSLAGGILLSVTALKNLGNGIWFMEYNFVIWPMLVTFPILILLGVIVPTAVWFFDKKESIVERLRKSM